MNDSTADSAKKRGYKFLICVIVVAVLFLVAFNLMSDWLNEEHNVNPAMANIANLLVPVFTTVFCGLYLWAFRRGGLGTLLGLGMLIAPFAFFTLFQPVFGGDAQIVRWDYRFSKPSEPEVPKSDGTDSDEQVSERIDLTTTTPYDFPRFLGTDNNGIVTGITLDRWDADLKPLWKQSIHEPRQPFIRDASTRCRPLACSIVSMEQTVAKYGASMFPRWSGSVRKFRQIA